VVGSLTITRYAREGCAYTKGFKLSIPYPRFRNYDSEFYVRNNRRNEGVANVAEHAKSGCKQYRLATRAVGETLTTPKED